MLGAEMKDYHHERIVPETSEAGWYLGVQYTCLCILEHV